ncbi:MAG: zinc metalloprotease, partial [Thermoanaerobaculia bacterium]|nr:zinc metalloprotease [Thermoanaerobaculia bacterium]
MHLQAASRFALALLLLPAVAPAQDYIPVIPNLDRVAEGLRYDDIIQVVRLDGTIQELVRCGTPSRSPGIEAFGPQGALGGSVADCDGSTNPDPIYDPGTSYLIDVWVHVIRNGAGTAGDIPVAEIYEQIAVLNEDYRGIPLSIGDPGADGRLFFRLLGYDYTNNTTWYNDTPPYGYTSLAVTPAQVLNIYTNSAGGFLGYVPFLPYEPGAPIGTATDRVVILSEALGRDRDPNPDNPYDLGRTTTHEVGHYFNLEHTFNGSCANATSPGCFSNGDLICDTPPELDMTFGCPAGQDSCLGQPGPDPIENYMDYTDDICMNNFTLQQMRRIRCTIENYRTQLFQPVLFYEDFET